MKQFQRAWLYFLLPLVAGCGGFGGAGSTFEPGPPQFFCFMPGDLGCATGEPIVFSPSSPKRVGRLDRFGGQSGLGSTLLMVIS